MIERGPRYLARTAELYFARNREYPPLLFEGRWHTSGELFRRAARLGGGLRELGIEPGQRVLVTMANSPEVGVVYQALWRAGAVVTPAMFLLPVEELRHVLRDSEASAVITDSSFAEKVREASAGLDSVRHLISRDEVEGFTTLAV